MICISFSLLQFGMASSVPFQSLQNDEQEGGGAESRPNELEYSQRPNEPNPGTPLRDEAKDLKERREGLRSILIGFGLFSVGITIALIVQIAAGHPQLEPHGAVASTSKQCSELGLKQLTKGGSAVDAAITTMLCMGVTHPQYAGIGGGGFMLVHSHRDHDTTLFDFRETAPSGLPVSDLLAENQAGDQPPVEVLVAGNSIGVPGEIRGMHAAWEKFGKLRWFANFEPVIELARDGFEYSGPSIKVDMERRNGLGHLEYLDSLNPELKTRLDEELQPNVEGIVKRPKYAKTLEDIAYYGEDAFYKGRVAQDIVDTVKEAGGHMSLKDLEDYSEKERESLKANVGKVYTVETFPAPASGAIMLRMLQDLEQNVAEKKLSAHQYKSKEFYTAFAKVQAETYRCRQVLGDPDRHNPLSVNETEQKLIQKDPKTGHAAHSLNDVCTEAKDEGAEKRGTSQISVIDREDLIVSVTQSQNYWFGSLIVTKDTGILLNNQMADFDWSKESGPNSPTPGYRPLSSMIPSVVYRTDRPCLQRFAIGGVNGSKIVSGVTQVISNIVLFNQTAKDALLAPRLFCSTQSCQLQNNPNEIGGDATMEDYAKTIRETVKTADAPDGVTVDVLPETDEHGMGNERCNVVGLAGRNNNGTLIAETDEYMNWGGAVY